MRVFDSTIGLRYRSQCHLHFEITVHRPKIYQKSTILFFVFAGPKRSRRHVISTLDTVQLPLYVTGSPQRLIENFSLLQPLVCTRHWTWNYRKVSGHAGLRPSSTLPISVSNYADDGQEEAIERKKPIPESIRDHYHERLSSLRGCLSLPIHRSIFWTQSFKKHLLFVTFIQFLYFINEDVI